MRSILSIILFFLLATGVQAGWFKSKSPIADKFASGEKATRKAAKNMKESAKTFQRDASYQSDIAKAKAKKYKAGIKENAKKAKKQADETSQEAMEKSAGFFRSMKTKIGAMFN